MDARRSVSVVRRWLWLVVASTLFASGAAYLVSSALPRTYEATVTLIVGQSLESTNPDYNQLLASQRLSQTYADLALTTPILSSVIEQAGLDSTPDELRERVQADAPRDSTLITIHVEDGDAQVAADLANAVAAELIAASPAIAGRDSSVQRFIDADLAAAQAQMEATQTQVQRLAAVPFPTAEETARLEALQTRLVAMREAYTSLLAFSSNSGTNLLTVVDPASPPTEAASPRVLLNTLVAGLAGALLAIGIAFVFEFLDDTLKSPVDVERATGLATLGAIMRMKGDRSRKAMYRLATLLYPRSPVAEAYRTLRTNVEFAAVDRSLQTLLVTSSVPGEGKTTTAANLALVFAQAGRTTLLVDADLRKPNVHKTFNIPNETGLTNLLRSEGITVSDVAQPTEQEHLSIITTGPLPPNPSELLRSQRMRVVLHRLVAAADLVIIDSPPLQAVTDAAILSSFMDGTLLVVDAGRTRREAVRQGRGALTKAGANVLGVILNRMSKANAGDYYYYEDYYADDDATKAAKPAAKAGKPGTAAPVDAAGATSATNATPAG